MTIREVLSSDWSVDRIDVKVRDRVITKFIMRYCIGRDVEAGRSERYAYEIEMGDVYESSGMKSLYINRTIQFYQLEDKPQGKGMCRGVLMKEIPRELLDLAIEYMYPYDCGWSDDLHGYRFDCYVDTWSGIDGENRQLSLIDTEI